MVQNNFQVEVTKDIFILPFFADFMNPYFFVELLNYLCLVLSISLFHGNLLYGVYLIVLHLKPIKRRYMLRITFIKNPNSRYLCLRWHFFGSFHKIELFLDCYFPGNADSQRKTVNENEKEKIQYK